MPKKVDLTGQRSGFLLVIRENPVRKGGRVCWDCRCDCGDTKTVAGHLLAAKIVTSCGCRGSAIQVGARFGRLVVAALSDTGHRRGQVSCVCDCGSSIVAQGGSLTTGHTRSCGCLQRELAAARLTTHGMTRTPTWNSWASMLERCYRVRSTAYPVYGARGVTVCSRWNPDQGGSFENFFADMGERPNGMTLDKDIKGGIGCKLYSPENCSWATAKEQARHRRGLTAVDLNGRLVTVAEAAEVTGLGLSMLHQRHRSGKTGTDLFSHPGATQERLVTANGQTRRVHEWAELMGVKPATIYKRLNRGWSDHDAVNTPTMSMAEANRRANEVRWANAAAAAKVE